MTVHVALLRAVMQGREGLTGDWLRATVGAAGGTDDRTWHATGNVLFRSEDGAAVCDALSAAAEALLGRPTPVLHRTADHLTDLVDGAFFRAAPDGAEHLVVFVDALLDEAAVTAAMPTGTTVVGRVGGDLACVRTATRGGHPMPALEAITTAPITTRSIGTVSGIVRAAAA